METKTDKLLERELAEFRELLRREPNAEKTFVSFSGHHMRLDLGGFLKSAAGQASLEKVVSVSSKIPKKDEKQVARAERLAASGG